jgi:hypothetical protein
VRERRHSLRDGELEIVVQLEHLAATSQHAARGPDPAPAPRRRYATRDICRSVWSDEQRATTPTTPTAPTQRESAPDHHAQRSAGRWRGRHGLWRTSGRRAARHAKPRHQYDLSCPLTHLSKTCRARSRTSMTFRARSRTSVEVCSILRSSLVLWSS